MATTGESAPEYIHLDTVRGLAALAVLVGHLRLLFLFPYRDLPHPSVFWMVLYFLTGFAHEAVIIFFVLSGLFISASVLRDCERGRWSWQKYLINRGSRLYVVLIPGLLLTALWDRCGMYLFPGHLIYSGHTATEKVLNYAAWDSSGLVTFVGNLFFLQTIFVLPFGTNGVLWSLSNEFWYYILFPCLWLLLARPQSLPRRLGYVAAFVLLAALVGGEILLYFPVWLLGTAVSLRARHRPEGTRPASLLVCGGLGATFLVVVSLGRLRHLGPQFVSDYLVAGSFAAWVCCLLGRAGRWTRGWYASAARALAGCSYTVYVAHFPVLVFLHAWWITGSRWLPNASGLALLVGVFLAVLGYAYLLSRLTEAHTGAVRRAVTTLLARVPGKPLPQAVPLAGEHGMGEARSQ